MSACVRAFVCVCVCVRACVYVCVYKSTGEPSKMCSELRSCVKVELAVLVSSSLINIMVSVDVNQN